MVTVQNVQNVVACAKSGAGLTSAVNVCKVPAPPASAPRPVPLPMTGAGTPAARKTPPLLKTCFLMALEGAAARADARQPFDLNAAILDVQRSLAQLSLNELAILAIQRQMAEMSGAEQMRAGAFKKAGDAQASTLTRQWS
jgi:hypothetical protein